MTRSYAMTNLAAGDWLLPGDDGSTLYRLSRYEEDGSLERTDGTVVCGTFWRALRCCRTINEVQAMDEDSLDWLLDSFSDWDEIDSLLKSRTEAVAAVERAMERSAIKSP